MYALGLLPRAFGSIEAFGAGWAGKDISPKVFFPAG